MYEVAQCGRFIVNICILAFLRLGILIRRGGSWTLSGKSISRVSVTQSLPHHLTVNCGSTLVFIQQEKHGAN